MNLSWICVYSQLLQLYFWNTTSLTLERFNRMVSWYRCRNLGILTLWGSAQSLNQIIVPAWLLPTSIWFLSSCWQLATGAGQLSFVWFLLAKMGNHHHGGQIGLGLGARMEESYWNPKAFLASENWCLQCRWRNVCFIKVLRTIVTFLHIPQYVYCNGTAENE